MANFTERKGQGRGMLLAVIGALTLALLAGMKFFMTDDTVVTAEAPAAGERMFGGPAAPAPPPGLNPASRPVSAPGSGLDMFSKANAGYYGGEESTAPVAAAAIPAPEVKRSTAPAARKAAAKPLPKGTVIPRMQGSSFGRTSPTSVTPHGAGQGMPDISGMLKQAQDQAGKNSSSGD